ncbi:hypothetical protein BD413DRAFT_95916 [Trametes elegans]|nr:hypothetical protein BD413DRAFT_95916 [Trametes elegans]
MTAPPSIGTRSRDRCPPTRPHRARPAVSSSSHLHPSCPNLSLSPATRGAPYQTPTALSDTTRRRQRQPSPSRPRLTSRMVITCSPRRALRGPRPVRGNSLYTAKRSHNHRAHDPGLFATGRTTCARAGSDPGLIGISASCGDARSRDATREMPHGAPEARAVVLKLLPPFCAPVSLRRHLEARIRVEAAGAHARDLSVHAVNVWLTSRRNEHRSP